MSENVVNIPRERFEQLASAPLQLAQMEAADMVRRGDVLGATRHLQAAVEQDAARRAQIAQQQPAAPPAVQQPAAPPPTAPAAPVPPLAAPGTPPPHASVAIPTEMEPGETMGQFYVRRGAAVRQAAAAAPDGRFDLGLPFGLRPVR